VSEGQMPPQGLAGSTPWPTPQVQDVSYKMQYYNFMIQKHASRL